MERGSGWDGMGWGWGVGWGWGGLGWVGVGWVGLGWGWGGGASLEAGRLGGEDVGAAIRARPVALKEVVSCK